MKHGGSEGVGSEMNFYLDMVILIHFNSYSVGTK